jgi:hypothetical protein
VKCTASSVYCVFSIKFQYARCEKRFGAASYSVVSFCIGVVSRYPEGHYARESFTVVDPNRVFSGTFFENVLRVYKVMYMLRR